MVNKFSGLTAAVLMLAAANGAQASSLVYKPTNPSFGGDPFNGTFLLSTAQAENQHERPSTAADPLASFERTITSSLLNRISFQIADQIFGENAADSGQFQVGDTLLNFQRNGDNIDVTLFDGITGGSTVISVPAPVLQNQE